MQNINIVTKGFCQWETKKESLMAGIKSRTGNKDKFHRQERVTTLTWWRWLLSKKKWMCQMTVTKMETSKNNLFTSYTLCRRLPDLNNAFHPPKFVGRYVPSRLPFPEKTAYKPPFWVMYWYQSNIIGELECSLFCCLVSQFITKYRIPTWPGTQQKISWKFRWSWRWTKSCILMIKASVLYRLERDSKALSESLQMTVFFTRAEFTYYSAL